MGKRKSDGAVSEGGAFKKSTVADLTAIALFVAVITVSSWIAIPFPIPLTMQICGVMLCGACLGAVRGCVAVTAYVALGAFGVPVFSGFSGGIAHLFGMTGGYILGFIPAVLTVGAIMGVGKGKRSSVRAFCAMLCGCAVCYFCGACYYAVLYTGASFAEGVYISLVTCVLPYLLPDVLKLILAARLWRRLDLIMKRN